MALRSHMRSHVVIALCFGLGYGSFMTEYELRLEAAHKGEKRYSGKPCLEHANAKRYTINGACVECTRERRAKRGDEIRELLKRNA